MVDVSIVIWGYKPTYICDYYGDPMRLLCDYYLMIISELPVDIPADPITNPLYVMYLSGIEMY